MIKVSPKVCVVVRRKVPRVVLPVVQKASVSMVPSAVYEVAVNHHVPDLHSLLLTTAGSEVLMHLLKL